MPRGIFLRMQPLLPILALQGLPQAAEIISVQKMIGTSFCFLKMKMHRPVQAPTALTGTKILCMGVEEISHLKIHSKNLINLTLTNSRYPLLPL